MGERKGIEGNGMSVQDLEPIWHDLDFLQRVSVKAFTAIAPGVVSVHILESDSGGIFRS